jgi:hypothetical protein
MRAERGIAMQHKPASAACCMPFVLFADLSLLAFNDLSAPANRLVVQSGKIRRVLNACDLM